jgi:hypothetical protein
MLKRVGLIFLFYFSILFTINACTDTDKQDLTHKDSIPFINVTETAGVSRIRESYSHCWGDINGDGLLDIFIINHLQPPILFMNNGNGTFKDISDLSKTNKWGDLHGCAIADYDNDGDEDIYVTVGAQMGKGVGLNRLYQNNGNGIFTDVADKAGVTDPKGRGRTVSWVDYNNDGFLDLFISNDFRIDAPSVLFRNNGNGNFSNVSAESGLNIVDNSFEASWIDYDNDGFMDLTIIESRTHRKHEINIYRNMQNGTFKKTGTFYGGTYTWGDYDNDGDWDLFVSVPPLTYIMIPHLKFEFNSLAYFFRGFSQLYKNIGEGQFIDVSYKAGFRNEMGGDKAIFFDYDNDGYLDIYLLVSGTKSENINDMVFKNNGDKTFTNITKEIGLIQNFKGKGNGAAYGDYNDDGFPDLFLTNGGGSPGLFEIREDAGPYVLYLNKPNKNHWLKIKLTGTKSNRDGIGARVRLYAGNQLQYRQNNGGMEGYVQHSKTIHFGLGSATSADKIEIIWPSGHVSNAVNIKSNQTLEIKE